MNPLYPIEWAVAWLMVKFHALLSVFMDPNAGITWVLSIVGLTAVVRTLIIPLFVRQIRASRAMQMVSPELQAVQKKYKGKTDQDSRQKMAEETMAIYKEAGASPFSSCLPVLLQMPIFFGLFRVLYTKLPQAAGGDPFGPLTVELARSANASTFFGNVTIADSFLSPGDGGISTRIVAGIIIALMCAVTFITQKELTMRNMPQAALEGPMAGTQKMMLYMLPFIYVITGPGMPIGVLVYWLTTNVWTFVQQWIVIRATPTPGSDAEKARHERINAKRAKKGLEPLDFTPPKKVVTEPVEDKPIRIQPPAKNKGGKKLTDQEKLERARAARAKAVEERRAAREAAGEADPRPQRGSNALNKSARKKKRKK
ncbi:membrane protein insertase YidC [Brachybacterium sp. UMB0905]|uniref:membrane protein insertase YidC n=1 Tax=Brachybacterium sp. UMB0905 TaxID=2069310 RepID=UPI000C802ADD|nr:membrane protein insertase YidC [Brachybacterium sp. UMB0905]PMC75948.1 membrane protein insertase YidC [Brachybacterium sp. UMB0905]